MATLQQSKSLTEMTHLEPNVKAMLDELVWWRRDSRRPGTKPSGGELGPSDGQIAGADLLRVLQIRQWYRTPALGGLF